MSGESLGFRGSVALALSLISLCGCSTGLSREDAQTADAGHDSSERSAAGSVVPATEDFDYEGYLSTLQQAVRIDDPPETDLIRVIAPDEQAQIWEECMIDAGWEVSTTFDGGLTPPENMSEDQWPAYNVSDYLCLAQYPVDDSLVNHYGSKQVDLLYEYYVTDLMPCLQGRGFDVTQPPSLEAFRASWVQYGTESYHAGETTWFPYGGVDAGVMAMDDWEQLNASCPQEPPHDYLFPSD